MKTSSNHNRDFLFGFPQGDSVLLTQSGMDRYGQTGYIASKQFLIGDLLAGRPIFIAISYTMLVSTIRTPSSMSSSQGMRPPRKRQASAWQGNR